MKSLLQATHGSTMAPSQPRSEQDVLIGPDLLPGSLACPQEATGLIIFVHGSGSSRHSPRNQRVSHAFNARGLATLLFDLLTEREARDRDNVFNIDLLGERVVQAVDWTRKDDATAGMSIGLFGASTGAAAALVAAANRSDRISAVVSRGGRPDLAAAYLHAVQAPTLLIVGGADDAVIKLNEAALFRLQCRKHLAIVPGATHLFEEPGTLDLVVDLAGQWFDDHVSSRPHLTAGR